MGADTKATECQSSLWRRGLWKICSKKTLNFALKKFNAFWLLPQNPDTKLPATSNILQSELGIPRTSLCFDINQGCSGFVIGLNVLQSIMAVNGMERGLLITADAYSRVLNADNRDCMPLFSDGAAAVSLRVDNPGDALAWDWGSDGSGASHLETNLTPCEETNCPVEILSMNGREVFNFALGGSAEVH